MWIATNIADYFYDQSSDNNYSQALIEKIDDLEDATDKQIQENIRKIFREYERIPEADFFGFLANACFWLCQDFDKSVEVVEVIERLDELNNYQLFTLLKAACN
jgi:uncharacterized membrane protein YgcG